MIKFFRKFRYDLMEENKTSKPALPARPNGSSGRAGRYFKYAVGEILLVVVGILIALQINNWNENRKQNLEVNQRLLEVRNNLVNDSSKMAQSIKRMQEEINIQQEIIDDIENGVVLDSTYNKKLGMCMTIGYMPITQNGYNALQDIGLEKINNKDLENELVLYYERFKNYYEDEVDHDRGDLVNVWLPYVRKNFKDYDYRFYAIPKDYEALSYDSEFLVMLKINQNNRNPTLEHYLNMKATSKSLISKINEELKN